MSERLAGKVALVTGGGGGIGGATAELFRSEGATVAIVDSDETAARRVADAVDPSGERVLAIGADLTRESEAERAVRLTTERFGRLDVLVNAAGVRLYGPITEAAPESWDWILGVNLLGAAYCSKYAVPVMARGGGGSIVNISSANGVVARPNMAQYDATKAALLGLTRAMACDHAAEGIRVNAVCPGSTVTGFHVRRRAEQAGVTMEAAESDLWTDDYDDNILKRKARPVEIAYPILFLASEESSFITGTTLMVDGGLGSAKQ